MRYFILLIGIAFSFNLTGYAQQKSKKVKRLESQQQRILKSIKQTDIDLKRTSTKQKDAKERLILLNKQVQQREEVVKVLDQEVGQLKHEIDSISLIYEKLRAKESLYMQKYIEVLKRMQREKKESDKLFFIASAKSFQEASERAQFIKQYAVANKKAILQYRQLKKRIATELGRINVRKNHSEKLLSKREEEKKNLEIEKENQRKEELLLQGKKTKLEKELDKQKRLLASIQKKIDAQIAYEIKQAEIRAQKEKEKAERLAAVAAKKAAQAKEKENNLGVTSKNSAHTAGENKSKKEDSKIAVYTPKNDDVVLSNSFAANKGRLPAPLNQSFKVVNSFGLHQYKDLSKVKTNSSGVELETTPGAKVRSVFKGIVSQIFSLPGFGTAIIIRHGSYLSVYANLSSVYVHTQQHVETGQIIGVVGDNPITGKPTLHFQLQNEKNKLNPLQWIR